MTAPTDIDLRKRVLGLHGLLTRWDELAHEPWLPTLLDIEETERQRRSLERRLAAAKPSPTEVKCHRRGQWSSFIVRPRRPSHARYGSQNCV